MGFFNDLGKKVERFKQDIEDAAASEADYACRECGERFYVDSGECPECGSDDVVALK